MDSSQTPGRPKIDLAPSGGGLGTQSQARGTPITPELLATVLKALGDGNARRPGIDRELREAFPGNVFSVCDDNDIPSRLAPVAKGEDFALYAISTSGHCSQLSPQIEGADGLAIGLINNDD